MSAAPRECEVVAFFLVHEHRQDLPIHPQSASTSTGFGRTATPCGTRSGADIDITTGNMTVWGPVSSPRASRCLWLANS